MQKRVYVAPALAAVVLTVAPTAWASFPAENGRLVFQSNRTGPIPAELYSMDADGTDVVRPTFGPARR